MNILNLKKARNMPFFLKNNMIIMSGLFFVVSFMLYASAKAPINTELLITGALYLDDVILYIVALEYLKQSLIHRATFRSLSFDASRYSHPETRILSLLSAFPFGLGVSSFLKGLSDQAIKTKPISEGMTASMLIYPTTLASGFVYDAFAINAIAGVLLFGIPVTALLVASTSGISWGKIFSSPVIRMAAVLGLLNYVYLSILSYYIDGYFMLKQSAFFLMLGFFVSRGLLQQLRNAIWHAKVPVLFFLCVGILGHSFSTATQHWQTPSALETMNELAALAIPIFAVPLLSMAFIHPLVLFLVFSPIISPILLDSGFSLNAVYMAWVVMLINAQLLSPVSITTVLSVSNSRSNIFTESFLKHKAYALKVSIASYLYLLITFWL